MRSKKALYNIITNVILQAIVLVYGFIVPKIIISNFGSNTNGLISSITQFLAYITLLEAGFGPVVQSILYKPIANKDNITIANILKSSESFFRTLAKIFLGYIVILCLLFPLIINSEFSYLYTVSLIIIIAISTFAEYYFGITYQLYLSAEQKTYVISIIQIVTYIISITFIIILAKMNASIHLIKLIGGLIFGLRPILQNLYVKKKYNINFKTSNSNYIIKNKWNGLAQHIAAVIHNNTDITIITLFCDLCEVSVYSVYYLVVKGVKTLITSLTNGVGAIFGDMLAKSEISNLNKKFNIYETIFLSITCIIFTCTLLLIVPFISIYTKGITDVNYIRPIFAYLIVISEYVYIVRLPYITLAYVAGHFKETRKGAWVEAITNILLSLILVWKLGIIGVAIGTLIAMTIRAAEFIYHTNKYILNRNIGISIKKVILIFFQTLIIILVCNFLPCVSYDNYLNWIINAVIIGVVSCLIVILFSYIFYKEQLKESINIIKSIIKK